MIKVQVCHRKKQFYVHLEEDGGCSEKVDASAEVSWFWSHDTKE